VIYGSVCSGIEAASVAWKPLGWRPAWFAEIDPFPSAVLAHRFPGVPNRGDFTQIEESEPLHILVGGTPCQSFSVAGLRGGMADDRGNLALEFLRLAGRLRPRWLVWENVPGVLSSGGGRDFGSFLGGLAELGYGWSYRVLDAQYVRVDGFGRAVPQRRRRVFVVGHPGDWRYPAAVLFDRESLSGNPPPIHKSREGVAPTLAARTNGGGGLGTDFDCDGGLVAFSFDERQITSQANRTRVGPELPCGTLHEMPHMIAFHATQDPIFSSSVSPPIPTDKGSIAIATRWAVRRLMPVECERLQGFPDGWTDVPYRGKPAKDGPRYKAVGNSMAVNVMRWIGRRIELVETSTC
jgi:DNA (cytosine-5)-methyltransferase 1